MYPYYSGQLTLTDYDIAAIRTLYATREYVDPELDVLPAGAVQPPRPETARITRITPPRNK